MVCLVPRGNFDPGGPGGIANAAQISQHVGNTKLSQSRLERTNKKVAASLTRVRICLKGIQHHAIAL
jgi:hypothetical protein